MPREGKTWQEGSVTFGIDYLPFSFLSVDAADTGRRDLRQGERRRSQGRRNMISRANDALVPHLVRSRGHPILKRIVVRMNETTDGTDDDNIALLSALFAYQKDDMYKPVTQVPKPRERDPRLQPAIAAIKQVFLEDYVGKLYHAFLIAKGAGMKAKKKGKCYGMFGGRLPLCTRKFVEYCFLPMRRFPSYLELVNRLGDPIVIVDIRPENERTGLGIRELTRILPEREDFMVHPFGRLIVDKLRNILRSNDAENADPEESTEEIINELAWEEINAMLGWGLDGNYNKTAEQLGGSRTFYYSPNVAKAIKEAYEEYYEDQVDEESWRIYTATRTGGNQAPSV